MTVPHRSSASMLEGLVAMDPRGVAVLSDYDGSLAPIVERPEEAVPVSGAADVLRRLCMRVGLVAVVSGRPVAFLRSRLQVAGLVLVGQYGLERLDDGEIVVHPAVAEHASAVAAARREARDRWPELSVEEKGGVAFTVHWRSRPDRDVASEVETLAARHGLVSQPGRMACEVRPPIAIDKATATAELVRGFEGGVFVGDDRGDLPAFAALDSLPVRLRVGVDSAEAPPELGSAVDLIVDGPTGAVAFLTDLAEALSAPR